MQEHGSGGESLNSSLTDLMTSLMVIFILLLLVFVHRTSGRDIAITDVLLEQLKGEWIPKGFSKELIQIDKKDRNAILVIVPDQLMNFESTQSDLKPQGEAFLKDNIPKFANILCGSRFHDAIESIIVEGYTDSVQWRNAASAYESQNLNLELSQKRSMEVVKKSLSFITADNSQRQCFLEKLSATGRGEQDLQLTPEDSRRVIFRIRVRADRADQVRSQGVK
jgi:outer membrane protein OmpA-like peptidoglycan-associated protein